VTLKDSIDLPMLRNIANPLCHSLGGQRAATPVRQTWSERSTHAFCQVISEARDNPHDAGTGGIPLW
jgi:hypothetical protein